MASDLDSFLADAPMPQGASPAPQASNSATAAAPQASGSALDSFLQGAPVPQAPQSGLQSAVTGFNRGVEDATWGAIKLGGQIADKVMGNGTQYNDYIKNLREQVANNTSILTSQAKYDQAVADNPATAKLSKFIGQAGAMTALVPGSGVGATAGATALKAAAQGALTGALTYDNSDKLGDSFMNAVAGGAFGGGIGLVGKYAGDMLDGYITAKQVTNNFVNDITGVLKDKYGQGQQGSESQILQAIQNKYQDVLQQKNALYSARDAMAQQVGTTISLADERSSTLQMLNAKGPMSPDQQAALKSLMPYLPNSDLSIKNAYNWVSELKKVAIAKNDSAPLTAQAMTSLAQTFQSKIDQAIQDSGNTALQGMHDAAQQFYAKTYLPIKEVATYKAGEKFTEDSFLNTLINGFPKYKAIQTTLGSLPQDTQANLFAYHLQSLNEAATQNSNILTGEINVAKYADSLANKMGNNPLFTYAANDLKTAGKALYAFGQAADSKSSGVSIGAGAYALAKQDPAAAAGAIGLNINKMNAFAGLAQAMDNPQIKSLLGSTYGALKNGAAEPVQNLLLNKTGRALATVLRKNDMYGRIGGIIGGEKPAAG